MGRQLDLGEPLLDLVDLLAGRLQRFPVAVDARTRCHRLGQLLPQAGNCLLAVSGLKELLADPLLFLFTLSNKIVRSDIAGLRSETNRRSRCPRSKHQQLGERVGAQAVGAVDAHAGAFTRGQHPRK